METAHQAGHQVGYAIGTFLIYVYHNARDVFGPLLALSSILMWHDAHRYGLRLRGLR
jgi:hypothetical protein